MSRAALKKIPLRANPFIGIGTKLHRVIFGLFVFQLVLVLLGLFIPALNFHDARWPDGLLVVLAAATTVTALSRQLPAQNVMLASVIVCVVAGAVHTLGALTGIPFGPYVYGWRIGQVLFYPLPWAIPLIWLLVLLNARGVGRLILRPWRKTRNYGFWVMGVTALLVVIFELGLEPFATHIREYWHWSATNAGVYWYSTPWVNFLGWAVTTLLILAFVTPSLINKKPVKHPPDFHPLIVWLSLNAFLCTATFMHHLRCAAGAIAVASIVAASLALRGAAW